MSSESYYAPIPFVITELLGNAITATQSFSLLFIIRICDETRTFKYTWHWSWMQSIKFLNYQDYLHLNIISKQRKVKTANLEKIVDKIASLQVENDDSPPLEIVIW